MYVLFMGGIPSVVVRDGGLIGLAKHLIAFILRSKALVSLVTILGVKIKLVNI
jgi:hypothetical protein